MKGEINNGKAEAFLICDSSFKESNCDFVKWLVSEGYEFGGYHGNYGVCDWLYVSITRKVYAYGMPGVALTTAIGNHAITLDEFMTIYRIYKKYEGKELFVFHSQRFDY